MIQTYLYETKKMFLHQKGFWFLGVFLLLYIASVALFDKPVNPDTSLYSTQYRHYLTQVQGKLTQESETFLQEEADKLKKAQITLEGLYENYYDGKLTADALLEKTAPLKALLQNKKGFDLIFEQYTYVREQRDNRYFLDTNGWNALLSNESLDFLLLVLFLLLVTPTFCYESGSKMDSLLLTQKKGARHTATCKTVLVFCMVLLLCIFTFSIKYLYFNAMYGLECGIFPLQSLPYFASSTKQLSLMQAFLSISVCKLFGFLLFSMLILFVSVFVKKYPLTLFFCTAAILLPYLGLGEGAAKYYLPLPLGFMLATGFFKGSMSIHNPFTNQLEPVFTEIPLSLFIGLFLLMLCIGIACYSAVRRQHTNAWSIKARNFKIKCVGLVLTCAFALSLAGCSAPAANSYDIYNMATKERFENAYFDFSVGYENSKITILAKDKATGEVENLIKSPMQSMTEISNAIYGNGKFVYYAKYDIDKSGLKPQTDRLSIVEVNTERFSEKIVFEKNISESGDDFLGMKFSEPTDFRYLSIYAFFLDANSIYILCGDEIMQISRFTNTVKVIQTSGKGNIAYDGRYLYYLNEQHQIVKHDSKNDSKLVFTTAVVKQFYLTSGEILFRNRQDYDNIYGMNLDNGQIHEIPDEKTQSVEW